MKLFIRERLTEIIATFVVMACLVSLLLVVRTFLPTTIGVGPVTFDTTALMSGIGAIVPTASMPALMFFGALVLLALLAYGMTIAVLFIARLIRGPTKAEDFTHGARTTFESLRPTPTLSPTRGVRRNRLADLAGPGTYYKSTARPTRHRAHQLPESPGKDTRPGFRVQDALTGAMA